MDKFKRLIVAVSGILALVLIVMSVQSVITNVPTIASIESLPVIIIDPGHGGIDGGAVGPDSIIEKDINLSIALKLRDMFVIGGFDVIMTRDTDISIHDENAKTVRRQKISDLHNRLAIGEKYQNAIFLSIHQNQIADSQNRGAQIFYSPNNPQSEQLAEVLQVQIRHGLQQSNKRQKKKAGKKSIFDVQFEVYRRTGGMWFFVQLG